MHLGTLAVIAIGLAVFTWSHPIRAAPQNKQLARLHFTQGKRHFLAGKYKRAVRSFKQAYRFRPHRVILFNIALSYARLGDSVAAATHLRRYLKKAQPSDPPLPRELRQVQSRVGVPKVQVKKPGPLQSTPPPPRGWRRFQRLHWAYFAAGLGATVGLVISAVVTSARAQSIHDDYARDPTNTALADRGLRMQRTTNALWGLTAVSAVGTTVLAFFTRWRRPERARRFGVKPHLGPGQIGFSLDWKY